MRRRWPTEVREEIWTLLCAQVRPTEVLRRIRAGETNLGRAEPLPEATYWDIVRRLKAERGEPLSHVEPGAEASALEAIARRSIAVLNDEIAFIQAKSPPRSKADRDAVGSMAATALKIRRELDRQPSKTDNATQARQSQSLLSKLQEQESRKQNGTGSDQHSEDQALTASQAHSTHDPAT